MSNSEITSGGDRHGMGVDILIRHLKNEEKMIIQNLIVSRVVLDGMILFYQK